MWADMYPEKSKPSGLPTGLENEPCRKGDALKSVLEGCSAHEEPRGPTKVSRNVKNESIMPAVSIACNEALFTGPSTPGSTPGDIQMWYSDAESPGCKEVKIGNMNPFKAYIVSRGAGTSTDRTHSMRRGGPSFHQHDDIYGATETLTPVRVIHTMCSTERESIDGRSGPRADAGYCRLSRPISPKCDTSKDNQSTSSSDEDDDCNARESLTDTKETIPFAMLPTSTDLPDACDEPCVPMHRAWESGVATAGEGSTARMHSSTYLDDFYLVPQGNLSIFSGDDAASRRDTNLAGSPEKLYSQGVLSLDLASTVASHSMPSIAVPQGSEMEFSQLVGKRKGSYGGVLHTPMGSASVDEVWDDLFAGGTTVQNGSAKTCLTSWEHFFPKGSHKAQSVNGCETPVSGSDGPMSQCSTMNHTNLESSPRDLDDVSSRWSGSDDEFIEYPGGFEVPSLKLQGTHETNLRSKRDPPMHLLPAKAREEAKVRPVSGEKVMNAFYTSQPSKASNPKDPLCHHVPQESFGKINAEESCTTSRLGSARSRARFSVFLETGYPSAHKSTKSKPRAGVVTHQKTHASTGNGKMSKRWRSILSSCSVLFKCFKEDSSRHPMSLGPLEGISELPKEYEEYLRGGGKCTEELYTREEHIPENMLHLRICVQGQTPEYSGHRPSRLIPRFTKTF